MRRAEQILVRGLVAGLIGATTLALWFLIIDTVLGHPFYTPMFLANVIAHVDSAAPSTGLILMYTTLHYVAFILVGLVVAWLMSQLEAAPSLLLGVVLGFLLFDLVFYFGIVFTGVDVVGELGWPEVLFGNLFAGMALTTYLHLTLEKDTVTWWQALAKHRIIREGTVAGVIGAIAVAVWFMLFDLFRGQLFFTPGALGSAFFLGVNDLADVQINLITVGGYTVIHVASFIVAGLLAAAIAVEAERTPALVLLGVLLFVTFEAFFLALLAVAAQWLLGAIGWIAIGMGNLWATAAMATYLLRVHPGLREALLSESLSEEGDS